MARSGLPKISRSPAIVVAALGLLAIGSAAFAQQAEDKTRSHFFDAIKGKKIVWIAAVMGNDLQAEWDARFRELAANYGMDYSMRDANFNTQAQSQAMEAVIGEKPDILVVQSLNVTLLARQIKRAEQAGIPVIQLNMKSLQDSTGFIGADYVGIGQQTANEIVDRCSPSKGGSGKVAIIQGEITAADSYLQMQGAKPVFDAHPEIKVVANQAGEWDPNKAHDIATTVLQQNPDLCAFYGLWGGMAMGIGQAIKEAGLLGKVANYSNDGGARYACDATKAGLFTKFWSYDAPGQARDVMQLALYILQNKIKPGALKGSLYSPMVAFTPETVKDTMCYDPPKR
jgi:ribose transport system substrate-binding protein